MKDEAEQARWQRDEEAARNVGRDGTSTLTQKACRQWRNYCFQMIHCVANFIPDWTIAKQDKQHQKL